MFNHPLNVPEPIRLNISAIIPVGRNTPATITLTLDPPSDRYAVVWHQDTITDVFTPAEAADAISTMVHEALNSIERGTLQVRPWGELVSEVEALLEDLESGPYGTMTPP